MCHSVESECGIRRRDGKRTGGLHATARSDAPAGLPRRDLKQLVAETREPLPMQPGQPARFDYEYERNGTANAFMLFAPLEGWRHVKITERRTSVDYVQV